MTMTWEAWTWDDKENQNKAWEQAKRELFILPGQEIPASLYSKVAMLAAKIRKESL